MRLSETIHQSPIAVEKSVRGDELRAITSGKAGVILPLAFVPLLREDRVSRGSLRIGFDMQETIHPLLNSVNVSVQAHFVSPMCFERFKGLGLDSFNRAYQGVAEPQTGVPIPLVRKHQFFEGDPIYNKLGVHWPESSEINAALVEAYNAIVNMRRKARSEHLPLRNAMDVTLAQAFWKNRNFAHVVPDFDQAMMDGEVELQFNEETSTVFLRGIGRLTSGTPTLKTNNGVTEWRTSEDGVGAPATTMYDNSIDGTEASLRIKTNSEGIPTIRAELAETGIRLSLANIELAKKTAAFAKLRDRYKGVDDDHIIDLLMEGIRVPDEVLGEPILLASEQTIFGYTERKAMDGESLDISRTTGRTDVILNFRTPPMNTGGVIMITAEIVPEQLWERQKDFWLGYSEGADLPNFMRDFLDPEKVAVVPNDMADVLHSAPDGVFGYAPLNYQWKRSITRAGGKFIRPNPDTFVEDRQRFWSVDIEDPLLTEDFYLVPEDLPHTVFADTASDPFEVLTLGSVEIVGNTVFGAGLEEDQGSYEAIMDQVDTSRVDQSATTVTE